MDIYCIAACDPMGVMGKSGKLPWHLPEDLHHFSETTRHHVIVMGFRTYSSLPKIYFKERLGIVFSHYPQVTDEKNVIFVNSLEAFLSLKGLSNDKKIYVIGGAQIYTLFLQANLIKEVILTKLKQSYEGDVLFPLSLICAWPYQKVQENQDFAIYHYFNPTSLPCK